MITYLSPFAHFQKPRRFCVVSLSLRTPRMRAFKALILFSCGLLLGLYIQHDFSMLKTLKAFESYVVYTGSYEYSNGSSQSSSPEPSVESLNGESVSPISSRHTNVSSALPAPVLENIPTDSTTPCCLRPSVNLIKKFTPQFFEDQRNIKADWTGKEYEDWRAIATRSNPSDLEQTTLSCDTQFSYLVLEQSNGPELRRALNLLEQSNKTQYFFYEETIGLPRVLLLGDSISINVRYATQTLFRSQANILGSPTNCASFNRYENFLKDWLGHCPWDVVQFNVGMHFHPKANDLSWEEEYANGIRDIVHAIRTHSPKTKVVFALTTPSPFDSMATFPNKSTCQHYDLFHKAGFVSAMNDVVLSLAGELGLVLNDRYSLVLPNLQDYQNDCDIHFNNQGNIVLAKHDWEVISSLLFQDQ